MPPVAWGVVAGAILILVSLPKVRVVTVLAVVAVVGCSASSRAPATPGGRRTTRSNADDDHSTAATASRSTRSPTRPRCRRRQPALRLELPAMSAEPRRRADHRRRQRQRRRHRAAEGRRPRRRRRDRPALYELGPQATPTGRTRTRGSTCTSTTAAPSSSASDKRVRPDPVRPARLADPGHRPGVAAPGELPVHHRGVRVGPRPPHPGGVFAMYNYYREDWLIDRLASTLARRVRHGAVRRHAVARRQATSRPGRAHASEDPDAGRLRSAPGLWDAPAGPRAPADDHPVPVPAHGLDARVLRGHHRADPRSCRCSPSGRRRRRCAR